MSAEVKPIGANLLAPVWAVAACVGWGLLRFSEWLNFTLPVANWSALAITAAVSIGLLILAVKLLRRSQRRLFPAPGQARYLLALGQGSALVGSLLSGGYFGYGLATFPQFQHSFGSSFSASLHRPWLFAVFATLLLIAGLVLQQACRIPKDETSD